MNHYILDGHETRKVANLLEWARAFESQDRIVKQEAVETPTGQIEISTVFLGLDHNHHGGTPLLFETMVFKGPLDGHQWRCTTWEQAESQHESVAALVRAALYPPT